MEAIRGDELLIERMEWKRGRGKAVGRFPEGPEILITAPGNAGEPSRLGVVWLQVPIRNRPIPDRARNPVAVMLARLKIQLARPDQGAAIKTRAAPEDTSHVESPGGPVHVNRAVV